MVIALSRGWSSHPADKVFDIAKDLMIDSDGWRDMMKPRLQQHPAAGRISELGEGPSAHQGASPIRPQQAGT
jgi:hypothetical protein